MMANVTDVRFSKQELDSYTKASNSCVKLEKKTRVLFLLPSHFADLNAGVRETLDSLLLKYDYLYKAIIIGHGKIKIQSRYGSICYGRSKIALQIEAGFYLFNPVVGCKLRGVVCKQSAHHLGCLVYKAFNVSIPLDEDGFISGWDFTVGQDVMFTVIKLDLTSGPLPYIRGQLDDDEIKGKHPGSSGSQIGTDSGFDNGTEDDLDIETEESDYEAGPVIREATEASLSKVEKGNTRSKQKKADKKNVGKILFLQKDGENVKSASVPQEAKNKMSDSKPTPGEMKVQACDSPKKINRGVVNEHLAAAEDCDVMRTELKQSEKSKMTESKTHQLGEKIKKKSKKQLRESLGKRDSLITQLLKTMEVSFEGDSEGVDIAATKEISKHKESMGSNGKKGSKKNSRKKSIIGINSPTSVGSMKDDKMKPLLEEPSHLGSNEGIVETSVDAVILGKEDEKPSPLKKVSRKIVLGYDNVLSPSSSGSLVAMHSITTKDKTGSSFDDRGSKEMLKCDVEGGIVSSRNVSPREESESESIIDMLLGMNKKLLGVGHSSKKNSSRKSTGGVNYPPPVLNINVDKVKPLCEEPLLSGGSVDAGVVGTSGKLGNPSEELERPTPFRKEGRKKSLTNDGVCSPSTGKRKSVGDKLSSKIIDKTSLEGKESQLSESKTEGGGVYVLPKKKSDCEIIIDELLSMNKKLLGVASVDCGDTVSECSDSSKGKVSSKTKRKRESTEFPGSPQPKVAKLKISENLEKQEVVKSNFSPP